MSERNVEVVRRFLVLDVDEALEYARPRHRVEPHRGSRGRGTRCRSRQPARWKGEWEDYELLPEEFDHVGDRVVVAVRMRARGRASGIPVDARLYDVYTLREGKIVRMDQFTRRSEALEAAGLAE